MRLCVKWLAATFFVLTAAYMVRTYGRHESLLEIVGLKMEIQDEFEAKYYHAGKRPTPEEYQVFLAVQEKLDKKIAELDR